MKFCSKCGKELMDEAVICINCGCSVSNENNASKKGNFKNIDFGWALLGFFIPLLGVILLLAWNEKDPLKARSLGKGALVSVVLSFILAFLFGVIVFLFMMLESIF